MGGHESVSKDNFDANKFFRDQFKENHGIPTRINMYLTVKMMMLEGYQQSETEYVNDIKKPLNSPDLSDPKYIMRNLNQANWQYRIQFSEKVVKYYLNDLDCLRINLRWDKIEKGLEKDYYIYLPISECTINLKDMEAYFDKYQSKTYQLVRSETRNRQRNWNSKRYVESRILFTQDPEEYKANLDPHNQMTEKINDVLSKLMAPKKDAKINPAEIMIGYRWSITIKGDIDALPSMNEVFYGLFQYIGMIIRQKLSHTNQKPIWIDACIDRYKKVFDYILELMEFENSDIPLSKYELKNPNSKATCMIMYIYSMETPFSLELNYSWKSKDASKIKHFGPMERALYEIFNGAEQNRTDRLDSSALVSCSQQFLLFKGATMRREDIKQWSDCIGQKAILPGNTGFSESLRMALCSSKSTSKELKPVLFVLNVFNEINYPGFRLNNEKYSAYPNEYEVIIPGGETVEVEYVDGLNKDKPFEPKHMYFHKDQPNLNDVRMYIIYLVRFG